MSYARFARSWSAIIVLVLAVTTLRLAYLAWMSPYALVEDEAHYWEWSRNLDWSFYSKGPGVALAIRAATSVFGDTEFAVRLPAVIASMIVTLAIAGLASDVTGDRRAGFFAAVCTLLTPIFQFSAILMTIDGPYVACWAVACWAAWRALQRGSWRAWPVLGLALAIGFLFKYTIVLLPAGFLFYLVSRRGGFELHSKWKSGAFIAVLLAIAGTAPIVIWNSQHDWVTLRHLLGHVGMPGGDVSSSSSDSLWRWNPMWTLELIGTQAAMIGGSMFLGFYSVGEAIRRRRRESEPWTGRLFMICCSAPLLLFYLGVTLFTPVEGNWPMGGFVTLLSLCGWGVVDAMDRFKHMMVVWKSMPSGSRPWWGVIRRKPELHRQMAWHATVVIGVAAGIGSLRLDLSAPVVNTIASSALSLGAGEEAESEREINIVPLGRLMSARGVAAEVSEQLTDLAERTKQSPMVIAQHYGRASQLAFYLPGKPVVYSSSSAMGGRETQYDLWSRTDLANLEDLAGRPAVLLGGTREQWTCAFERIEAIGPLQADHKPGRGAFLGFGYVGFGTED